LKYLEKQGKNTKHLWDKIKDLIIKTFCAGQPNLVT
jgi:hypothetical protein